MSIKLFDHVLLSPISDAVKIPASTNHVSDLLCFLFFLHPRPRQRRDVARAHQTLPQFIDTVFDMIHAHELVFPVELIFGIEPFAYRVLMHSVSDIPRA